jgi:hypothetical protein
VIVIELDDLRPTALDRTCSIEVDATSRLLIDGESATYSNPVIVSARRRLKSLRKSLQAEAVVAAPSRHNPNTIDYNTPQRFFYISVLK